jgi:hypothetical protein
LSDFSPAKRILIFFLSFVFVIIYAVSHVNSSFLLVEENIKFEREKKIMIEYISILEIATMQQSKEIEQLKNSCN